MSVYLCLKIIKFIKSFESEFITLVQTKIKKYSSNTSKGIYLKE